MKTIKKSDQIVKLSKKQIEANPALKASIERTKRRQESFFASYTYHDTHQNSNTYDRSHDRTR